MYLSDIRLLITSNKGHIGHCFSAAGIMETLFGFESLRLQTLLPTFSFKEMDICFIGQSNFTISPESLPFPRNLSFLLKNSFGFGGVNNSLLFRKLI